MNIRHCWVWVWLKLKERGKESKIDEYNDNVFKNDLPLDLLLYTFDGRDSLLYFWLEVWTKIPRKSIISHT